MNGSRTTLYVSAEHRRAYLLMSEASTLLQRVIRERQADSRRLASCRKKLELAFTFVAHPVSPVVLCPYCENLEADDLGCGRYRCWQCEQIWWSRLCPEEDSFFSVKAENG